MAFIAKIILTIISLIPLVGPPFVTACRKGTKEQIVIAFILSLCLHIPGVIYALWMVWRNDAFAKKYVGRHIADWAAH